MNLWSCELPKKCRRVVASQAEARTMREYFIAEFGVPKKAVIIEPCVVPTSKPELIQHLNELLATIDATGEADA